MGKLPDPWRKLVFKKIEPKKPPEPKKVVEPKKSESKKSESKKSESKKSEGKKTDGVAVERKKKKQKLEKKVGREQRKRIFLWSPGQIFMTSVNGGGAENKIFRHIFLANFSMHCCVKFICCKTSLFPTPSLA